MLPLLVLVLVVLYAGQRRVVEVVFELRPETAGALQVFFDADGRFRENASDRFRFSAGDGERFGFTTRGGAASHLRFDPEPGARLRLCELRVGGAGLANEYRVVAASGVHLVPEPGCLSVLADADAYDPQFVVAMYGHALRKIERGARWNAWFVASGLLLLVAIMAALVLWRQALAMFWRSDARCTWLRALDRRAHWICVLLMLCFGGLYAFVTPPGGVPDEGAHMAKVLRIVSGVPFGESGARPLPDMDGMYGPFRDFAEDKSPFSRAQLETQTGEPLACEPVKPLGLTGANSYFPHQYAMPSLAFAVSCGAGASFGGFLYSARILNLLLATLLCAIGVATAARGKWALVLVAALPMSLFQVASVSADSLGIGLGVAWLGATSGIAAGRLDIRRAMPWLAALSLAIGLLKPGAAWVLASFVFCAPAWARAGRSFPLAVALCLLPAWALHVGWTLWSALGTGARAGVDPAANWHVVLHEPMTFLRVLGETFLGDYGVHLRRMLIGILGWIDVPLSAWAYPLAAIGLAAAWLANDNDATMRPPAWVRPLAAVFCVGSLVLLSLPLFVQWTLPGAVIVEGLQGRYFLPTLAFFLVWCGWHSPDALRAWLVPLIIGIAITLNIDGVLRLDDAFYVTGR